MSGIQVCPHGKSHHSACAACVSAWERDVKDTIRDAGTWGPSTSPTRRWSDGPIPGKGALNPTRGYCPDPAHCACPAEHCPCASTATNGACYIAQTATAIKSSLSVDVILPTVDAQVSIWQQDLFTSRTPSPDRVTTRSLIMSGSSSEEESYGLETLRRQDADDGAEQEDVRAEIKESCGPFDAFHLRFQPTKDGRAIVDVDTHHQDDHTDVDSADRGEQMHHVSG